MPRGARCQVCSVSLPAVQRRDTRYCGSTCRVRASRARRKGRPSPDDLRRRWAWSRTPTETRSWVLLWYRRLAHSPLRALAAKHRETQALHAQLAEAHATIRQQATELAALRQQLAAQAEQSARDAATTAEQHNKLQAELTSARESSIAHRQRSLDVERQLSDAVRQRDHVRHDAHSLRAERNAAQIQACRAEANADRLGHLLAIKSREADAHRTAYTQAQRRLVRLRRTLVQSRTLSAQRARLVHALHQRYVQTRQHARKQQAEQDQKLKTATERLAEKTQSIATLTTERDKAQARGEAAQTRAEFVTKLLEEAYTLGDGIQAQLAEAKQAQDRLTEALNTARAEAAKAQQDLARHQSETQAELTQLRAFRDCTKDPKPEIEELKRQIVQLDIRKGHAEYQRDESKKVLKIRTDLYKYYDWCNSRRILDLKNQIRELGGVPRETVIEEPPPPDYQGGTGEPSDPAPTRSDPRGPRRR